jgi:DNA polymerase-3 subunit gamma/tau
MNEMYGQTFNIKVKSAKKADPADEEDPTNQLLHKAMDTGIEVEIKN